MAATLEMESYLGPKAAGTTGIASATSEPIVAVGQDSMTVIMKQLGWTVYLKGSLAYEDKRGDTPKEHRWWEPP